MSAYHRISEVLSRDTGFRKSANQVVMRLSDIRAGVTDDPSHGGENILVEWGLQKLVDFINAEQWEMADDLIFAFPRTMCACSDDLFGRLVELRHEFERTGAREVIVDDLKLSRRVGPMELEADDDDELAKHSV